MNSGTRITVKTDLMSFVHVVVHESPAEEYSAVLDRTIRTSDLFAFSVDAVINNKHDVPYSLIDLPYDQPEVKEYEFFFRRLSKHSASTPNGRLGILGRYDLKEFRRIYNNFLFTEAYAFKTSTEDYV